MSLKSRIARLEKLLPRPLAPRKPDSRMRHFNKRFQQLGKRLDRLIENAKPLLTEAEREPVEAALQQWLAEEEGPYRRWFTDLASGTCRLPELPPLVMKALLVAWLSPNVDTLVPVCQQCGLEYPQHVRPPRTEWKLLPGKMPFEGPPPWYDLPEFFPSCPGCGASTCDIDWAHGIDGHRSWMDLDGCAKHGRY